MSTTSEYKTINATNLDYKSVLMASMVPLRIRKYADSDSSSTCFKDIWKNPTPGSKAFCRPIRFKYTKETKISTQDLIRSIESEIKCLEPVTIKIGSYSFNVDFDMKLTMIDGKVSNAITETSSNWNCSICGKTKSQFWHLSHGEINEEVLKFGISPLHARIRFLEHFLHIAYDMKYRSEPQNKNKPSRNNKELMEMRANEKKRIQKEFKEQTGLNIDMPLVRYGSTNDGNTARRFFQHFETTSAITGIDKDLLQKVNVLLMAINSKHKVNPDKFDKYCRDILTLLFNLYSWKEMTPTVHKVLCHGKIIIQHNILPLGELTEESQESRNKDLSISNNSAHENVPGNLKMKIFLITFSYRLILSYRL